jgi:RNA polymerase subunit RPABC4/transcription elongation factor Spt4
MLDLKKCPQCWKQTDLNNETCPYCGHRFTGTDSAPSRPPGQQPQQRCPKCGAPVPAGRKSCPVCSTSLVQTSRLRRIMVFVGFVAAVLVLSLFIISHLSALPGTMLPAPARDVTPAPTMPECNVAITGQKLSGDTIQLNVMAMTCVPGDISRLRVIVDGRDAWTLDPRLAARGNFPGHAGPDTVVVVAVFSSGYEKTVLDSTYT